MPQAPLAARRPASRARLFRRTHGRLLLAAAALLAPAAGVLLAAQASVPPGRTVWDGVYTEAQAERGTPAFNQSCANCHTLSSDGNGPLSGDKFWGTYSQRTVGELLTYVRDYMPNGNGNSLPASTYNELVALILKSNGFPAGTRELSPVAVSDVQIVPKDGPGELPANALVRMVGCLARDAGEWVLTNATAPERIDRSGASPEDAGRALGNRAIVLKFVLTPLDSFAGQRVSVSGLLLGAGGVEGINVTAVDRVAEVCR
jgi:mono/diheme cytochrome c family protein